MKKLYSFLSIFALSTTIFAQVTLAEWAPNSTDTPGGAGNFGPSPYAATTSDSNLTIGGLTRGAGYVIPTSGSGAALAWGGTDLVSTDAASAATAGDYATFTITAKTGYKVSVTGVDAYNVRKSQTGPTSGQWQYQVGSGAFVNIGTVITWGSTTTAGGNQQSAIDLSGIADLQNLAEGTTVTFRVLAFGASGTGGTWYLVNGNTGATSKTLTIKGTVAAVETMGVADTSVKSNFVKNTLVSNAISFVAKADVKVYNMNGQVVKAAAVSENKDLNVADLTPGTYVVTATVNGKAVSQKIIKK